MSSKLFLVAGASLLVGGGLGAFVTQTIYGGHAERVDPSPDRPLKCPEPKPCICPPPVDCGENGIVPDGAEPVGEIAAIEVPDTTRPGLPASALGLATAAVKEAIAPCLIDTEGLGGNILLRLTVTSTGGQGFIRTAEVTKTSGEVADVPECVSAYARRAKFEFETEGETQLQLPIKVN